ncbi:MAG: peptidylprolyl isomerase [Desulfovibrionaceae bacterium]|nr:peptidylprolyl isomerase [Desulfovibrionaceae bacterium]
MSFKQGDTIRVTYTGTLEDGTIFDTCSIDNPLEVVIGSQECLPIFEEALIGKNHGDTFTITIKPQDGYGERDEDLVHVLNKELFNDIEHLRVGMILTQEVNDDDEPIEAIITDITEHDITIDENHPLAGKVLYFEVSIV